MVGAVAPAASAGRVQVTDTFPTLVQVQPAPVADTNVTPTGSVSVTDRFAASDGPLFTTTSEYDTLLPATTVAGPVLVIARSADAVTLVTAVEVLFAGFGSAVVEATEAVFVSDAAWVGAVTVTVIVGAVAPAASAGRVQVTETLPTLVHVQPVPVADTKVTPAGSVSITDRLAASEGPLFTTTSEYATDPPATTSAGPVLVIARSAEAVTMVFATDVLLAGFGSAVVEDTDAVFDSDPAWFGAVTTIVIVGAVAPVASDGRVQVTDTFPTFEHVHPVPAADTNVTPAGSVSATDRFAASEGPLSVTTSEYDTLFPATTVAGPVLVIARSADAVTPVVTDEVLLAGTGSAVVDETDAVLVSDPACAGAVTTTVIVGAVAPATSAGRVQVTDTFPTFEHAHPVPAADTNVTPAGSVSVTDTFAASDGPPLTTTSEYATDPPATTVGGPSLVIDRSADAVTVVTAVDVLLAGTGSAVVEETDAVFDSAAAWFGAVTTIVIVGAVAPVASAGRVQVTDTFPTFEHVHPAPVADTNVTPAGSVSATDRFAASEGPLSVTTSEYDTLFPATTVAGPVLVIARSADAVTVVFATEVLFAAFGSAVVLDTLDVFDSVAAWPGAVTTIVIVGAVAPATRAGLVQDAETFPTLLQVHPVPVADTNVMPAGSVSVTVSEAASDGPLFTTTSEYDTDPPATTVAGPVLVIARSADGVTVVLSEELLLAAFGSAVVAATDATFDSTAPWAGAVTVTVIAGADVPVASAGLVQLTDTFPVLVQVQPVPVAETNVTPAGSVSVTVREAASDGPAFATASE